MHARLNDYDLNVTMRLDEYLINKKTIALNQTASHWKDAVRVAVQLLENAGSVTSEYYNAILDNHEKNGPYYVIVPSVAMPHAAPDKGVCTLGFSLVTLKTPVVFGHPDHDPVEIVLCIASPDRKSLNEEMITQVMELLDNDETIPRLRAAQTLDDVANLFHDIFLS